jgi:hypothetical protein
MHPQKCFEHCIIRIVSKASEYDFVWFGRQVPAFQRNLPPLLSVWKSDLIVCSFYPEDQCIRFLQNVGTCQTTQHQTQKIVVLMIITMNIHISYNKVLVT